MPVVRWESHGSGRFRWSNAGPPEWDHEARCSMVLVKCATSAECKIYSNSHVHGIGQPVQDLGRGSTVLMIIMMEELVLCSEMPIES